MSHTPEATCDTSTADQVLNGVKIPSLPEAAMKLLSLCRNGGVGASEVVRVIALDPALTTRVLRAANSPMFGQQKRVSTLTRAAVVLGNEALRASALGFYLSSGWERMGCEGLDVREFWRDSVLRACLSRRLAKTIGYQPTERAFLVGLLQNIGTLILGTHFGPRYAEFLAEHRTDDAGRAAAETELFGTDHVTVAATLAERWRLPETFAVALGKQCTEPPVCRTSDCNELFWQVAYFCANVPFSADRQTARIGSRLRSVAYGGLGLSFERLSRVFDDVVEQYNALRGVFAHLAPRDGDVVTILSEAAELIDSIDNDGSDLTQAP